MKFLKKMFSSSNEVSWGRAMCTLILIWLLVVTTLVMYHAGWKWQPIDTAWRDLIVALFGISKGGETAQTFAKKEG